MKYQFCHILALKLHTSIHLKELVDNIYHVLQNQIQQLLLTCETLVFHLKVDYCLIII